MNFDNFVEMSKKTKSEIMAYIKSGASNVRRLYHTDTWYTRILKVVNSEVYDKEAMNKIDALLNEGEITFKNLK